MKLDSLGRGTPPIAIGSLASLPGSRAALRALKRPGRVQVLLYLPSGSFQERPKRALRGFLRGSASKIRFGPHFGPTLGVQNETPGLEKSIKILARFIKNQGFAVLSLVRFRV